MAVSIICLDESDCMGRKLTSLGNGNDVVALNNSRDGVLLNGSRVDVRGQSDVLEHDRVEAGVVKLFDVLNTFRALLGNVDLLDPIWCQTMLQSVGMGMATAAYLEKSMP